MNDDELETLIRELVVEKTDVDEGFDADAEFNDELGIDSLVALEIITDLERKLEVKLPPERYAEFTTVNESIELLQQHLG